jgi:hypothetical protein
MQMATALLALAATVGAIASELPGIVVDLHSGKGVESASVRAISLRDGAVVAEAESAGDGKFTLTELSAGAYRIEAQASGYVAAGSQVATLRGDADPGELVRIPMVRTSAVAGRVIDSSGKPMADVRVVAVARRWRSGTTHLEPAGPAIPTDSEGRYRLHGLAPARSYSVLVMPSPTKGKPFAPAYLPGVPAEKDAALVHLEPGEARANLTVTVPASACQTVSGRVTGVSGSNVRVLVSAVSAVHPDSAPIRTVAAEADGAFQFQSLPQGAYQLLAVGPVTGRSWAGAVLGGEPLFGRQQVTLGASPVDQNLSLELRPGLTLLAEIKDDSGEAVSPDAYTGSELTLYPAESWPALLRLRAVFSSTAKVTLTGLPPGTYTAQLVGLRKGYYLAGLAVEGSQPSRTFEITGDTRLQLILSSRRGAVAGTVAQNKGDGLTHQVRIHLVPTEGALPEARSALPDSDGRFRFDAVVPGKYRVFAAPESAYFDPFDPPYCSGGRRCAAIEVKAEASTAVGLVADP